MIRDYTERSLNDREWGEQFVTQRVRGELVMAWSLVTPDITTITGDIDHHSDQTDLKIITPRAQVDLTFHVAHDVLHGIFYESSPLQLKASGPTKL